MARSIHSGDFYFVDAHWQRIYRWSAANRELSTVRDNPLDPINLAFDRAGNLMVISYAGNGTVYFSSPARRMMTTILLCSPLWRPCRARE